MINVFEFTDYRDFLEAVFYERTKGNPSYTMRAFSIDLGLRPPAFNDVLNRRYGFSRQSATKLAEKLQLDETSRDFFVSLVEVAHSRSVAGRQNARKRIAAALESRSYLQKLSNSQFSLLKHWYAPAILEALTTGEDSVSSDKIAERFGLSQPEVDVVISELVDGGFVKREGGRYVRTTKFYFAESAAPQSEIRNFHIQLLGRGQEAIANQDMKTRKTLSSVFNFDETRMKEAREELERFHARFMKKYSAMEAKQSVYALTLNLFTLERK